MGFIVIMIVNALVRRLIKGSVVLIVKLEFGEVSVPLYFFGKILVKLLFQCAFLMAAMAI